MKWIGLVTLLLAISQAGVSQETRDYLSVDFTDLPLEIILDSVTYKTGYFFSYNADAIPEGSLYTLKRTSIQVDSLISLLLVGTGLEHIKEGDQIIIRQLPGNFSYKVLRENNKKSILRGWVRHKDDNSPVVGANVFLNGTTIGSVTDPKGNYAIREVPPGTHQLVISHVGYETNAYQVKTYEGNTYVFNSFLELKTQELPSVEVVSLPLVDSADWRRHFRTFQQEFIGYSNNSPHSKILNPEVVSFTYDKEEDILKAYLEEPLVVENRALGYLVTCQLEDFQMDKGVTRFHIRARFENMLYEKGRTKRRWKRNRKLTYGGSSTHFFRSLIADKHRREGFRPYLTREGQNIEVTREELIKRDEKDHNWTLRFEGTLVVRYLNESPSPEYLEYINQIASSPKLSQAGTHPENGSTAQVSMVELLKKEVVLFNNGQVQQAEDIVRLGYWSWERIADLMPINYDPKNDDF